MKNPAIVFFDSAFGYGASYVIEADRDLTEKELRKWWRHYVDRAPAEITVSATYETLDGETRDITEDWVCHECAMYSEANGSIFN